MLLGNRRSKSGTFLKGSPFALDIHVTPTPTRHTNTHISHLNPHATPILTRHTDTCTDTDTHTDTNTHTDTCVVAAPFQFGFMARAQPRAVSESDSIRPFVRPRRTQGTPQSIVAHNQKNKLQPRTCPSTSIWPVRARSTPPQPAIQILQFS